MAVSAGFKQQCPTCETLVPIKDANLVGKKIECPKCKDRFVVEDPSERDKAGVKQKDKNGKAKGNGKAGPAKAQTKRFRDDEEEEEDEAPAAKKSKAKAGSKKFRAGEEEDDDDAPKKKKSSGSSKMTISLALAGVGVVVLAVAAYFIIGGGGGGSSNPSPAPAGAAPAIANNPGANNTENPESKDGNKGTEKVKTGIPFGSKNLAAAGVELTNLLPNESEHVLHVNLKDIFDSGSPFRDLVFNAPGALSDDQIRSRLGFSVLAMDTLLRADCYSAGWTYTVLHFTETINQKAITEALGLKPAAPINNLTYLRATKTNSWHEELARLTFGVSQRSATKRGEQPVCVKFHNSQTLIIADEAPMVALLKANGQFRLLSQVAPAPAQNAPPGTNPMYLPPGTTPMNMPPGSPMMPPGSPMGSPPPMKGASLEPEEDPDIATAQIAPVIIAPPLNVQNPATQMPRQVAQQQVAGANSLDGTSWKGSETLANYDKLTFVFNPGNSVTMHDAQEVTNGTYQKNGNNVTMRFFGGQVTYEGTVNGKTMTGSARSNDGRRWNFNVSQVSGGGGDVPMMPPGSPMMPPGSPMMPPTTPMSPMTPMTQGAVVRSESYLTIRPNLKQILDRVQYKPADTTDKLLFSSVTDLSSARVESRGPEMKNRVAWQPRQLWDITQMLEERRPRIRTLATAFFQREPRTFQYRTELDCLRETDAKDLQKDITDKAAPHLAKVVERLLSHTIDLPKVDAPMFSDPSMMPPGSTMPPVFAPMGSNSDTTPGAYNPMYPGGQPPPGFQPGLKEEIPTASQITLKVRDTVVDMKLDLVLDQPAVVRLNHLVLLIATTIRSELDLAAGAFSKHDLAQAVKHLGEKGVSDRVAPGRYPPGAFKRAAATRVAQQPYHRMSWMASLLPHLGHQSVYDKIDFDKSWQDPHNWLAARAIIPQFLDPQYPEGARFSSPPGLGIEMAATNVVGITGIGLDAAEYPRDDPAFVAKRGVFSYEGAASLEEIAKGRGLSNTMVMAQIPHDGPGGVSPWIAGGGAGLRGVPEKNSVAPFLLTTDRYGKAIQHNGKRGTFVYMADGSVRFVSAEVSDDVFKAMATIGGPAPENFDLNKNQATPLVPREEKAPVPPVVTPAAPEAPAPASPGPGGWLSADAKAFHEGVVKTMTAFQTLEKQALGAMLKIGKDKAQLEAALPKLAADVKALVQQGRQLKAPGKGGEEYFAAFTAFLDFQDQSLGGELDLVLQTIRNPTPDAAAKLTKLAQEKMTQQLGIMSRLTNTQSAFLQAQSGPAQGQGVLTEWTVQNMPGGFSAKVPPGKLTESNVDTPGIGKMRICNVVDGAKRMYQVASRPMITKQKAEFSKNADEFYLTQARIFDKSVQKLEPFSAGGIEGRQLVYPDPTDPAKTRFARIFVLNGQVGSLMGTSDQAVLSGDAQTFLDSLQKTN